MYVVARFSVFVLLMDLTKPRDQRIMRFYGEKPIQVNYRLANFGGHIHSDSGDIVVLVCHVILKVQVIKGSCDFTGRRL